MKKKLIFFACLVSLLFVAVTTYASTRTSLDEASYQNWMNSNYGKFNVPVNINDSAVNIDGATGEMTVRETDLHLPGKNGLDLNIMREYDSLRDITRLSGQGYTSYENTNFIQARYILPSGNKKLVRFVTADEYYQNGTDGIYTNSDYADIYTDQYYKMTRGSIYLQRDTSYAPIWNKYDRTFKVRDFSDSNSNNDINIGYNWNITFAYSNIIAGPFSTGFTNEYCRYRLYRLTDGRSFTVKETYRVYNNVITTYEPYFESAGGYEVLTPYKDMPNNLIVDTRRGITYFYSIRDKNGSVWYFDASGIIMAEEDKYGNIIKYQHTDDAVTITDTMGRVVTVHKNDKKISLTTDVITEDMVYYDCISTDSQTNDFSDYYSKYTLEVKKRDGNESEDNCVNVTAYEMAKRTNVYDAREELVPHLETTYILQKIVKSDESYSAFDYSPIMISNTKSFPLWEYFPSHSEDVQANGTVANTWNYSYVEQLYTYYHQFIKTRGDGDYVETSAYRKTPLQLIFHSVIGDGIKEEERYSYFTKKSILASKSKQIFNLATGNNYDYIEAVVNYEYDARDTCIHENNMGQEVWYDYGDSTANPYNLLLSKTYEKDGQKIKIENTLTSDLKSIQDTKEYIEENGAFVLQSRTGYEYDFYGNVSKITEYPQFATPIEHHVTYTYDLPKYSIEKYALNVTNYDGTSVSKIGTLEEYDKYGRLWRNTDGEGNKTTYSYDRIGRLLCITNDDGTMREYDYDVSTNTVTAVNENGTEIKQTFDMRGRKLATYVFNPNTEQYVKLNEISYDPYNGQIASVMELGAENQEILTLYTWDDAGRVKTKQAKEKNANGTYTVVEEASNQYTYPTETGTRIRAAGYSTNTSADILWDGYNKKEWNVYSAYSNAIKTFNITGDYDYLLLNVRVPDVHNISLTVYADSTSGTKAISFSPNVYYYDSMYGRSLIINAKGVTALRVAGNSVSYSVNVANVRGYTKEQISAMTTKATTTAVGDSTITPPKVEQTFDFWGNKIKQRNIDTSNSNNVLAEESWAYDSLGNNLTYRNPVSSVLNMDTYTRVYDYAGRVISETMHDNQFGNRNNNTVYDKTGRIASKYNTKNNYTYQYDQFGRVIAENHQTNGGKNYKYDKNGNVIREQETIQQYDSATAEYTTTDYAYDNRNRLVKTTQYKNGTAEPQITQYYYDAGGNMLRMYIGLSAPLTINGLDSVAVNGDGKYSVTKYKYNFMNQRVSTTDALNQMESYTYDYLGNILTKTDRNGNIITYTYNWRSQPLTITSTNDSKTIIYTYDRLGNRTSMTDEMGTTHYNYNNLSQLVTETKGDVVKTYSYDANGSRTGFELADSTEIPLSNSYVQSNTGWVRSVTSGTQTVYYGYDVSGNVTSETLGDSVSSRTYNASNYMTDMINTVNGAVKSSFSYTPLMNGNVSGVSSTYSNGTAQATNYTYDGMGRLLTELSPNVNHSYTYDDSGNRVTITGGKTYQYDLNNRLLTENGSKGAGYQYDPNGNLFSRLDGTQTESNGSAMTVDVSENLGGFALYTYDGFNRLVKIKDGENVYEYEYNGDGQRVAKIVNGTRTDFIWDGDYIVAEICGDMTTACVRGLRLHFSKDSNGEIMHYLYNGHGDVVQTLDENKSVVNEYQYDAFGNEINPDSADANPWRYCGEYTDLETNNIYLRARYYDPSVGRFISEDPIRDGTNWYIYCYNNPIGLIDPFGLAPSPKEAAEMASHIYEQKGDLTGGWKFDYSITGGDGMVMGIYMRLLDEYGSNGLQMMEYALVNKGTTATSLSDWNNNVEQVFGNSADMEASIAYAKSFVEHVGDSIEVTFVGHSKGGAEATANAIATNKDAIIFNPAALSQATRNKNGLNTDNYTGKVTAYVVQGDALNQLQGKSYDNTIYLQRQHGNAFTDAILPRGVKAWQSVQNHLMPAVQNGLKQRR